MIKNYVEIPSSIEDDINRDYTKWVNGKCVSLDEGVYITVFIGHFIEEEKTMAYPIRVEKPLSRDSLINAAEMQAYELTDAMSVASFTASLARKSRENENDEEVKEHDNFIEWVKDELTKIGI